MDHAITLLPLEERLYSTLDRVNIAYTVHTHVPVFTVEEAQIVSRDLPGAHSKNLFLKDKKKNYTLISVLEHKRVDLKALAKTHAKGSFSFTNDQDLEAYLGVLPGSVTPMGLIQSAPSPVRFLLDQDFQKASYVHFHPLRNDKTLRLTLDAFLTFLDTIEATPTWVEVPVLMDSYSPNTN